MANRHRIPREIGAGQVRKSPDGWARFRARTDNGASKRPGFRPLSHHRPNGGTK